jgi:hypothetical protein
MVRQPSFMNRMHSTRKLANRVSLSVHFLIA